MILNYIENKTYFSMKELLYSIVPMHREYTDYYPGFPYGYKESSLENCLDEISSNFLMMYILSQLARYQPQAWVDFLKGDERGEAYLLNRFLKVSETYYPELIYHELKTKASKGLEGF